MRKASWYFVALDWEVLVGAVRQHFHHAGVVFFQDFLRLLAEVDLAHSTVQEFFLNLAFVLLESDVWKLDHVQPMMLFWNLVPDEGEAVFAQASDFVDHQVKLFLRTRCLFLAVVDDACKLVELL